MRKVLRCCIAAVMLLSPVFTAAPSFAADMSNLTNMSLEDLLFMDVSVVTAGRTEQTLSEAPAAMYVVTAEDIKNLGATQLQEALTMIPGLNLRRGLGSSAHIGGIRGVMGLPANKIVLLIDGEPWQTISYNDILMSLPPIPLADIDRIEVLEGPGSSLYGSNAVTGVINIISKKLKDTKGGLATFTGGQYNTYVGELRYGGSAGENLDYRVSASYYQRDNFGKIPYAHNDEPSEMIFGQNAWLDYRINDNSSLSFMAGATQPNKTEVEFEATGPLNMDNTHGEYAMLKYFLNNPNIMIGAFWNNSDYGNAGYSFGKQTSNQVMQTGKLEAQNTLTPVKNNTLVWGADVVQNIIDGPAYGGKQILTTPGVFVDDTHKFTSWFTVNAGARYSKQSNADDPVIVDRFSMMFYPWANHRIRLTQGTSYRDPSATESYYHSRNPYTAAGMPLYYDVVGHKDLKPEKANSYEVGYSGRFGNLGLAANAYTMNVKDFVSLKTTALWLNNPLLPKTIDFVNGGEAEISGTEVEVRYLFTSWLSGLANYTHIYSREVAAPAAGFLTQTPEHMANAQLTGKFDKLTVNLWGNYVSETKWATTTWGGGGVAPAYTIANLFVGYKVLSNLELSVTATNLFDKQYKEYPINGVTIGRRVTGTVSYTF